jgi:hypothetical protein
LDTTQARPAGLSLLELVDTLPDLVSFTLVN